MRLLSQPPVILVPVGPIETATHVQVKRGGIDRTILVTDILPSYNKVDLPDDVIKAEFIRRAWLMGTTGGGAGNRPVNGKSSVLRDYVNNDASTGIFGGKGRVFVSSAQQTEDGLTFSWGLSGSNTANGVPVLNTEIDDPNPEDMLEAAIPLISGYLASRDGNTKCLPSVSVKDATRLYQKIIDLVASYEFYYISF